MATSLSSSSSNPNLFWPRPAFWCWIVIVASVVCLIVLRAMPGIDIWVSMLFFNVLECPEGSQKLICGGFDLRFNLEWRSIRRVGFYFPQALAVATLTWLLYLVYRRTDTTVSQISKPLMGLGSFFMGPVILTNYFFKPLWGRPRPHTVEDFAGPHEYVLPGDFSTACSGNCSFVSGEAGAAFWLLWLLIIIPGVWRWPAAIALTALALFISFLRIAFGGHFFSDIVMAGFLTAFCIAFLGYVLQHPKIVRRLSSFCERSNAANLQRHSK